MDTIYLTDLDGTLLDKRASITSENVKRLNYMLSQGLPLSFATARSFISAQRVVGGINFSLPIAAYNGAFIVDPKTEKAIRISQLDRERIAPLLKTIEQAKIPTLVFSFVGGIERLSWIDSMANAGIRNFLSDRKGDKRLRPVSDFAQLLQGDIFMFTMIGSRAEMMELRPRLGTDGYFNRHLQRDIYYPDDWYLEISRHDATKAEAARAIKEMVGARRMVCFGDNLNDLPMFLVSDACYAVANAHPDVLAFATGVIPSNEEGGVVQWLTAHGEYKTIMA